MIVVTGGAGYIGGVVLEYIESMCHKPAYCIDNLTYRDDYLRYAFENVDITNREKLHETLDRIANVSCIIHLAAIVGDGACQINPARTVAVNVDGTKNIADWAREKGVRLIYASTCSVYGASDDVINEDSSTCPISLYASTKLAGEEFVKQVDDHLIFRLGTIFGLPPHGDFYRIRSDLVINAMAFSAATSGEINVFGPNQWRPFIHVHDVARLICQGAVGSYKGTFILASQNMQLSSVADVVSRIIPAKIITHDGKPQDLRNYSVLTTKALRAGFFPVNSVEYGVEQIKRAIKNGSIKNPWLSKYNNMKFLQEQESGR